MRFGLIGVYSCGLGLAVLALWAVILSGGGVSEGPVEIGFHLLSEFLMALICLAGGAMLLRAHRLAGSVATAGHAMVVYSTLNAAGYYGERGEAGIALVMGLLALVSAALVAILLRATGRSAG